MSTAIRVQCDGLDHTCPVGRFVPTATTTREARTHANIHWGWTTTGDDDYCPTCTITPRTRPTPPTMRTPAVVITDNPPARCPRCDNGDHHTCTHHHCHCTTTPTCGSTR